MNTPQKTVYCYTTVILENGSEQIVRFVTLGEDHADAAREAFRLLSPSFRHVREIQTFDGEPRRWKPDFEVEEIA